MNLFKIKNKIKEFLGVENRDCECRCCGTWKYFDECYWNDSKHKESYCSEECREKARSIEEIGGDYE